MVSFVSISNGLGGVEKNDLKKFIINLIITKTLSSAELHPADFVYQESAHTCLPVMSWFSHLGHIILSEFKNLSDCILASNEVSTLQVLMVFDKDIDILLLHKIKKDNILLFF